MLKLLYMMLYQSCQFDIHLSNVVECAPHPPKGEKERGAAGGSPPRHALSLLLLPPQAASLS